MQVQYIDLKILEKEESAVIIPLVDSYIQKLERITPNATLILHVHKQKTAGKKSKYSFKVRLDNPNVILETSAFDWDIARTAHKVLKQVEKILKKKYKKDAQKQERAHPINPRTSKPSRRSIYQAVK